jgi:hypothetical protein
MTAITNVSYSRIKYNQLFPYSENYHCNFDKNVSQSYYECMLSDELKILGGHHIKFNIFDIF